MNIIRNTVIATALAAAALIPAAVTAAPADAVTAATQQQDADIDAILDEVQTLVESYEKVRDDLAAGKTVSEARLNKLQQESVRISEKMQTLGTLQPDAGQEKRANDLITRLYTVISQLQQQD